MRKTRYPGLVQVMNVSTDRQPSSKRRTSTAKTRITIRLDEDVVIWFKEKVAEAGGGSYQRLINRVLREHIGREDECMEILLRRILREELPKFFY